MFPYLGLNNHFIYFNDDFFLFRNTSYLFFFNEFGVARYPNHFGVMTHSSSDNSKILKQRVYPETNIKSLNITFKVPFKMKQYTPYQIYTEHVPRPYTRSSWYELQLYYPEWFQFVESHKDRFCSSNPLKTGCFEETIYLIMMTYRILHNNMMHHQNLQSRNKLKLIDNGDFHRLVSKKEFDLDVFNHSYTNKQDIHMWLWGKSKLADIRSWTEKAKGHRPHTICINDDFTDIHSMKYKLDIQFLHQFYQEQFKDPAPFEKENFIEPALRNILERR